MFSFKILIVKNTITIKSIVGLANSLVTDQVVFRDVLWTNLWYFETPQKGILRRSSSRTVGMPMALWNVPKRNSEVISTYCNMPIVLWTPKMNSQKVTITYCGYAYGTVKHPKREFWGGHQHVLWICLWHCETPKKRNSQKVITCCGYACSFVKRPKKEFFDSRMVEGHLHICQSSKNIWSWHWQLHRMCYINPSVFYTGELERFVKWHVPYWNTFPSWLPIVFYMLDCIPHLLKRHTNVQMLH